MPFTDSIDRSGAAALIPEPIAGAILQNLARESAVLSRFTRVQVPSHQTRLPMLSQLPWAYWVNGDTGLKQVSKAAWEDKTLTVEEIAVILPIPRAVLDDAAFDVWAQLRPQIEAAFGRAIDQAVFFGVDAPSSFPTNLVAAAVAAGNTYTRGTSDPEEGGLAEDINQTLGKVERWGFVPSGIVTSDAFRVRLRGARDANGQPLADASQGTLYGLPVHYTMGGLWPAGSGAAQLLAGDWSQFVVGIRSDLDYMLLDQAVLTDGDGRIVFNLAQQDMVALRVFMRLGWQVANPLTFEAAVSGINEVQTVTIGGSPTGGSFQLAFNGFTTRKIPHDASADALKAALEALGAIGQSNVTVGKVGSVYTVTFVKALGSRNVPAMTADGSDLTGGSDPSVAIATTQAGSPGAGQYPVGVLQAP